MKPTTTRRRFLKMGPLNLKSILKPGVGNTPLAEEARSGPLEATISALSTTYKEGQAVLCSYEGKNYPAKILEVSTKRKIEAINVMTQLAKEQHLNVDEMDVETPPLGNDDEDKILFYVHYIRWKPKWDEWVDSTRLSATEEAPSNGKQVKRKMKKIKGILTSPVIKKKKVSSSVNGDNEGELKKVRFKLTPKYLVSTKTAPGKIGGKSGLMKKSKVAAAAVVSGTVRVVHEKRNADDVANVESATSVARLPEQPETVEQPLTKEDFAEAPMLANDLLSNFPLKLKAVLIYDYAQIRNNGKIVNEQSNTGLSAENLLTDYEVFIQNTGNDLELQRAKSFIEGLRTLMHACISNRLLYMEEYENMMALKNAGGQLTMKISAVYILRLLTRLEELLGGQLSFNKVVQAEKRKFIEFIASRSAFYFPISIYIKGQEKSRVDTDN